MTQARRRMAMVARTGRGEPFMRWEVWQRYGEWFESMPWDLFATLTMPAGASREQLLRCHARWSRQMAAENGRKLRQVLAIERQKNGTPHAHVLVYGIAPGNAPADEGWHAAKLWERVGGGHARVWPYTGAGGAASYCAKYVTKDGDVELIGPWPWFGYIDIKEEPQIALPGVVTGRRFTGDRASHGFTNERQQQFEQQQFDRPLMMSAEPETDELSELIREERIRRG